MSRLLVAVLGALFVPLSAVAQNPSQRHIQFHYKFSVRNLPQGKPARIWFPQAKSDDFQTVAVQNIKSDLPVKQTREGEYGNSMYYAETLSVAKPEYTFDVTYDVVRREHKVNLDKPEPARLKRASLDRFLQPDKLVPISGLPANIASKQVVGAQTALEKAHALYQYTLANMKYDKTGTGWGRGDTLYACDAKHGNCSDFHSLFISMARSQGIPARFEIGFPLPAATQEGEIPGYHCWAEFYDPQHGWVPVDISEAWKDPSKRDYFFGAHDVNRVQFSMGRDITLSPKQAGDPLNYFVYPYVEVAGKKWENVATEFSFADLPATKGVVATGR